MKFLARFSRFLRILSQQSLCRFGGPLPIAIAALSMALAASAQQSNPPAAPSEQPQTPQPQTPVTMAPAVAPAVSQTAAPVASSASSSAPSKSEAGEVTEDELKQQLVGKPLFLRGGFLGESLSFTEHGAPVGHPSVGSYTLCAVEIEKVHLTKHKVELDGTRYALHFLGALPSEDPSAAVDRVKITPKKKMLKITIDREQVVKEKKSKDAGKEKKPATLAAARAAAPAPEADATATAQAPPAAPVAESSEPAAADKPEDKPADQASVTTTLSPAHAAKMLREALDRIFAPGLDDKLRAQMPAFWQLYYKSQAAGVDYRPSDPSVIRSAAVDQQARLTSSIAPDSNEFAQASGIAGRALYRAVIGADGKPAEIAVVRPIGFGLDENAVAAIRKASFQPAIKNGQPVAESLDLAVLFRIYSKRTSVTAPEVKAVDTEKTLKPGPYTVRAQQAQPAPEKQPDSQMQPPPQPETKPDATPQAPAPKPETPQ